MEGGGVEGVDWFASAEAAWDAHCQGALSAEEMLDAGICYSEIDTTVAAKWYRKSADAGHAGAQTRLGNCYVEGRGVKKDAAKGVKLFKRAAAQKHAEAEHRLGECLLNGTGVAENEKEAVRLFCLAAAQSFAPASRALGDCHKLGLGVPKNERKAEEHYETGARQHALATAVALGGLVFEGLQPSEPGAAYIGGFELMEPLQVFNRRAVWRAVGGNDRYTFVASNGRWWISRGESMRTGKDEGWVCSVAAEPGALTPDQVTGGWRVSDGKGGWVMVPSLRVRQRTAEDKAAEEEGARRQEAEALQQASALGGLVFEGPQPGEPGAGAFTGGFDLTEPLQVINRRAVWRAVAANDRYAFVGNDDKWYIGSGASMCAGKTAGSVCSVAAEPGALTPDQVTGGWGVSDGKGGWAAVRGLRVRQRTAEDKAALVEEAPSRESADQPDVAVLGALPVGAPCG